MVGQSIKAQDPKVSEQAIFDVCELLSPSAPNIESIKQRLQNHNHVVQMIYILNDAWLVGAFVVHLKNKGIWRDLNLEIREYLTHIEKVYISRAESIQQELILVAEILQPIVDKITVLKGAACLFNGVASPISTRFMNDIDILINEKSFEDALVTLEKAGFSKDAEKFEIDAIGHHHAPPLLRKNSQCYVEVHRRPLKLSLNEILPVEQAFIQTDALELTQDLKVQQLSPTHQVIHSIAHSELSDGAYEDHFIDLKQQVNLISLIGFYDDRIDWELIEKQFSENGFAEELKHVLYSINRLFGIETPITNLTEPSVEAHWLKSIKSYCETQGRENRIDNIIRILKGYSKKSILDLYGTEGTFPLIKGRWKHFKRHFEILLASINKS